MFILFTISNVRLEIKALSKEQAIRKSGLEPKYIKEVYAV